MIWCHMSVLQHLLCALSLQRQPTIALRVQAMSARVRALKVQRRVTCAPCICDAHCVANFRQRFSVRVVCNSIQSRVQINTRSLFTMCCYCPRSQANYSAQVIRKGSAHVRLHALERYVYIVDTLPSQLPSCPALLPASSSSLFSLS